LQPQALRAQICAFPGVVVVVLATVLVVLVVLAKVLVVLATVLVEGGSSPGQMHGGLEQEHGFSSPVHFLGFLFLQ